MSVCHSKNFKKNRDVATRKQILNPKINFNRDVLTLYKKYSYENQNEKIFLDHFFCNNLFINISVNKLPL